MKRPLFFLIALVITSSACAVAPRVVEPTLTMVPTLAIPTATITFTPTPSGTPTQTPIPPTATPTDTPTPSYPPEGRGPTGFAVDVDPLTGLEVENPETLNRRPLVIKVENLPRAHRPQWGLTLADLVFEYYTEEGATRFAAVYYGSNAERVAPIRSGRFFDSNVVQMYKGVFVYGSAYADVQSRFFNSDFAGRLVLENLRSCPGLCRYDPNGENLLAADTAALMDYLQVRGIDNTRQTLDGMLFKLSPPPAGQPGTQVYVRYSGAIYNRWDYDPASGRYLRFSDRQDDVNRNNEVYDPLTDKLTGLPVTAENVVTLCIPHQYYVKREDTEVIDIIMDNRVASYVGCDGQTYAGGSGPAYIARDGQVYHVTWRRERRDAVLTLVNADGSLFPFKPGQTWFEVIGASSTVQQDAAGIWRFSHMMVP